MFLEWVKLGISNLVLTLMASTSVRMIDYIVLPNGVWSGVFMAHVTSLRFGK